MSTVDTTTYSANCIVPCHPSEGATKAEHKRWVDAVEAALDGAKSLGLQRATAKAWESTSSAVQAAKDSDFAQASMEKLYASWDSFKSHTAGTWTSIAEGYNKVHDSVVRDERYAGAVDNAAGMLTGLSEWAGKTWQNAKQSEAAHATGTAIKDFREREDVKGAEAKASSVIESVQQNMAVKSATNAIGGAMDAAYKWTVGNVLPAASEKAGQAAQHFAPVRSKSSHSAGPDAAQLSQAVIAAEP